MFMYTVGVANINNRLLPAFAKAASAELRAIASRSLAKAQAAAKAANIPIAHGGYDALLDEYEPGATAAEITRVFAELRADLIPLVSSIAESGTSCCR